MKIQNYDSGRSMVEMLGTLAIAGILSVAAIVGYSYAMDKYRANRTMYDVNIRAMDVSAQIDATGTATLDGWKDEPTLYPISLEEGTIGIQVDNVPQRVCEMIAEGMEHSADIKFITSTEASADCGDITTMVFYFDGNLVGGEGNNNEPVREQCGDILCEQCFTCNQDTMTCVSVMDELYETADNVDDFRICANNGYKSYCGLVGEGCAEIGTCGGDPECNVRVDGACQPLDSSMYLGNGLGGFRCTKDGKEGYCFAGVCSEEIPDDVTACAGKEDEEECDINGRTGMCAMGQCLASCSNYMELCDAFGNNGICIGVCLPLTDDGCHASLFGQTEAIPDDFAFACEKDGVEGVCIGGVCSDAVCVGKEDGETCTKNGSNGTCMANQCMASCSNDMGLCDAFGAKGVCADGLCIPLSDDGCSVTFDGQTVPIPDEFSFACEKDSVEGVCIGGGCATDKCGDTYCGQCFSCDESTNSCVSIMTTMDLSKLNLDDLRICTSNGYQSYCGLGDNNGCVIMGVCGGDPECNIFASGKCQAVDSSMFFNAGIGGFRCTKNGKDGYCMEGVCDTSSSCSSDSDCTNTAKPFCSDNGICIACTQDSHCGDTTSDYCSAGSCQKCSGTTPYRDAENGKCVACLGDTHCTDTTKPFCSASGVCGACLEDSHCTDATKPFCSSSGVCNNYCTKDSQCGDTVSDYCSYGSCYKCSSSYPYRDAAKKSCVACLENSHCTDATKPFCNNGTCGVCLDDTHCTDANYPHCYNGSCRKCTQDSHCGDTVSDYCSYGYCYKCSGTTPYRDTAKGQCVACLENSQCTDSTAPVCLNGKCSCTDNSQCTDSTAPICLNGKCSCTDNSQCTDSTAPVCLNGKCGCTDDSQCGDAVSGYCQDNVCKMCSGNYPYRYGNGCYQCLTSEHCGENQYCTSTHTDWDGRPLVCENLNFSPITVGGKTYYVSQYSMNWWNAKEACRVVANGMVDVDDLVNGWDGQVQAGTSEYYTPTPLLNALNAQLKDRAWTNGIDSSEQGTYVRASISDAVVSTSSAHLNLHHALCK